MGQNTKSYPLNDVDKERWERIADSIPRSAGNLQDAILDRLENIAKARRHLWPEIDVDDVLEQLAAGKVYTRTTDNRARMRLAGAGAEPNTEYTVIVLGVDDEPGDESEGQS